MLRSAMYPPKMDQRASRCSAEKVYALSGRYALPIALCNNPFRSAVVPALSSPQRLNVIVEKTSAHAASGKNRPANMTWMSKRTNMAAVAASIVFVLADRNNPRASPAINVSSRVINHSNQAGDQLPSAPLVGNVIGRLMRKSIVAI